MSLSLLLSGAALIFSFGFFFYFRAYIKKRTAAKAVLEDIRKEVNLLIISVNETTNRDITLLEDKENSLKALLEEIEKRLKVYTRELERSVRGETAYRELGRAGLPLRYTVQAEEKEAELPPGPGKNTEKASASLEAPLSSARSEPISSDAAPAASPSIGEEVRRLLKSGLSPRLVASKLGISISEVELAAALMERKPL